MSSANLDVIGVGNAIVDVLAEATDAFLAEHAIPKGGMILIDEDQAEKIYAGMGDSIEISGGSAANSIACVSSLGGVGGFIGKVADDALGETFRKDLRNIGVTFDTRPMQHGPGTGRCLVSVTPDAQRSMTTYLGAAGLVSPDDVDPEFIADGKIVFFEGYLFEQPLARQAFVKACDIARAAGRKSALTLSDASCVERQHDAFESFIGANVDILFANEIEAKTLFRTDTVEAAIEKARGACPLVVITMSENGSVLIPAEGDKVVVSAVKPTQLVDTTGAGDAYAAGVLLGIARDKSLSDAGHLGSIAAAEVISHFGARPQEPLSILAAAAGIVI